MADLTKYQKEFVEHYIATLNPFEAAILAGYPRDDAVKYGKALLKSKRVMSKIREKVREHAQNLYVTRSYIIDRLLSIIDFCMEQEAVFNKDGEDTGRLKMRDSSGALKALVSLSKLIEGCEKMSESNEIDLEVGNLNIENI